VNTLEQVRLFGPDLLVLDLNQRLDGRLLLARLKQDFRTRAVRIATVTGKDDAAVRRFCLEHHVASHELKPLRSTYLEDLVGYRSVLTRRPAQVA
jgi:CheY-like chemotaxis protein